MIWCGATDDSHSKLIRRQRERQRERQSQSAAGDMTPPTYAPFEIPLAKNLAPFHDARINHSELAAGNIRDLAAGCISASASASNAADCRVFTTCMC